MDVVDRERERERVPVRVRRGRAVDRVSSWNRLTRGGQRDAQPSRKIEMQVANRTNKSEEPPGSVAAVGCAGRGRFGLIGRGGWVAGHTPIGCGGRLVDSSSRLFDQNK